ncbi:MAG: hypothetical protein Q4P24_17475 [Rhodobacterales bacterium]|nr:hypothetical protein [Rhodobacterales bacterium]
MREAGLGLSLPTYAAGPKAVGWWAIWIIMLGDATAFASIVFGFFFYWTSQPDLPPEGVLYAAPALVSGAVAAPALVSGAVAALTASWALTLGARRWNGEGTGAWRAWRWLQRRCWRRAGPGR